MGMVRLMAVCDVWVMTVEESGRRITFGESLTGQQHAHDSEGTSHC